MCSTAERESECPRTKLVQVLRTEHTLVPARVPHERAQVLWRVDEVDLADHLEARKVGRDGRLPQRRDKGVVGVEVGDELQAARGRDDLLLEVLEEDAVAETRLYCQRDAWEMRE